MAQFIGVGKVLVIGDGDFSFSLALARLGCSPLYATSYESEEALCARYKNAARNIQELLSVGCIVLHNVDATCLHKCSHAQLQDNRRTFARIVFNFPHVGGKSDINRNRKLLGNFFRCTRAFLAPDGEVHVSLASGQGGTSFDQPRIKGNTWQIVEKAAHSGFLLVNVTPCDYSLFTEYRCTGYVARWLPSRT